MPETHHWWQTGVIYQLYPRSFQDTNADGIGDLPGITSRLDYVQSLGVDAIWLSPIFPSPMADFGYDVADYTDVNPIFGTLADFDTLLASAHQRGLKVMLDFVPNHTSSMHRWFQESRSSRDSPRRDWYIWRDPAPGGGPPNNWLSAFGGPAWTLDAATGQYYLHSFLAAQPDLNWRNPAVRAAMLDVLRFWLDRGVDGFRVDVINSMLKDAALTDNPPNPKWRDGDPEHTRLARIYSQNRPEVHEVIREFRALLDRYDERMMVGETYVPLQDLMSYYGAGLDEAHLPFNFELILLPWDARTISAYVAEYEAALPPGAWPNWVLGNHDQHRIASRVGTAQARLAQMLLLTLRGTPTCYYGDEIGMRDVAILPEQVHDPFEKNVPGLGLGRDPERTPMQWDATPYAGFSTAAPWLPVGADYPVCNVAAEQSDPQSPLSLFRALTTLRRATPALQIGNYRPVSGTPPNIFAYVREHEGRRLLVALNFGHTEAQLNLSALGPQATIAVTTHMDRAGAETMARLMLRPDEGLVLRLLTTDG